MVGGRMSTGGKGQEKYSMRERNEGLEVSAESGGD